MAYSEQEIQDFSLLIRQLLLKYKEMRQELNDMKRQFAAQEKYVKEMEVLANASMHDYDMLKAARIIEIGDGDLETARKHVNKLIRDVDRCITLLTEQQDGQ
ncbi:hypothetical protein HPS57_02495 [Prevotella sp. PINT]|mgnify:CR=1 FL=1|jgi:hypothetical protein|uniref:hypothetical protein n=1 Tax=Palleniella intestinalis TaxID=2736291 RepID=UPI001553FE3F|nr:hypothetical protein [Palleniella intestinalis]NPD80847.1 hypothetical protein [Palleniella intestinalis]